MLDLAPFDTMYTRDATSSSIITNITGDSVVLFSDGSEISKKRADLLRYVAHLIPVRFINADDNYLVNKFKSQIWLYRDGRPMCEYPCISTKPSLLIDWLNRYTGSKILIPTYIEPITEDDIAELEEKVKMLRMRQAELAKSD